MASIEEIMPFAQSLWMIDKRLSYHSQKGNMLSGLKYRKTPEIEEDGKSSFPYLRLMDFSYEEQHARGGPRELSVPSQGNSPTFYVITCEYKLTCRRANGLFRKDPYDTSKGKGLLEWLALVTDAIETDEGGFVDARLDNSTANPVMYRVDGTEPSQLGWSADFSVIVSSFMTRGFRSNQLDVGQTV